MFSDRYLIVSYLIANHPIALIAGHFLANHLIETSHW
jgi:hypothetical protein